MHSPDYPQDSTLRRHHESAEKFRREALLDEPPTDSILRRHYEQLQSVQAAPAPDPVTPKPAAAPVTPKPAAAPVTPKPAAAAVPEEPAKREGGTGLLGWLNRVFCRQR